MAHDTRTFRPREDFVGDFNDILEFCRTYRLPFNAVINSYLPAIAYAVKNRVKIDEETQEIFVQSDFGDVPILRGKENQTHTEKYS